MRIWSSHLHEGGPETRGEDCCHISQLPSGLGSALSLFTEDWVSLAELKLLICLTRAEQSCLAEERPGSGAVSQLCCFHSHTASNWTVIMQCCTTALLSYSTEVLFSQLCCTTDEIFVLNTFYLHKDLPGCDNWYCDNWSCIFIFNPIASRIFQIPCKTVWGSACVWGHSPLNEEPQIGLRHIVFWSS